MTRKQDDMNRKSAQTQQLLATVVFSHGKESGPWGSKITAMAAVARDLGLAVQSVDYRGIDDPGVRVDRLIAAVAEVPGMGGAQGSGSAEGSGEPRNSSEAPVVLVGSSMGGHVSAAAAARVRPRGVFLLAPAFYMPGFEAYTPHDVACPTVIVHGWHDDIVPVDNSVRWAREHSAALHLLDSGHRLEDQIDTICLLLRAFLEKLAAP